MLCDSCEKKRRVALDIPDWMPPLYDGGSGIGLEYLSQSRRLQVIETQKQMERDGICSECFGSART